MNDITKAPFAAKKILDTNSKVDQKEINTIKNADASTERPNDMLEQSNVVANQTGAGEGKDKAVQDQLNDTSGGEAGTIQPEEQQLGSAESRAEGEQHPVEEIDPADAAVEYYQQKGTAAFPAHELGESGIEGLDTSLFTQEQQAPVEAEAESRFYTCLPMKTYAVGPYKFVDGQLRLNDPEQIEEFEALINDKNFPLLDRHRIKTVDLGLAQQIAGSRSAATRGFDSGQNKDFEQLKAQNPKVGTGNMGTKDSGQKA